jgi:hypothetical protein
LAQPHDALFRAVFGDPQHAGPLLRALLLPAIAAAVDWTTLAPAPDNLVDDEQREQRTDRLFAVRFAGRPALLWLLLEHRSRPDRWTALDVIAFVTGLWKQLRSRRPRPRALPPVLPVVVHFGKGRWRASTDLRSLVDLDSLPPGLREQVAAMLPQFTFRPHDFAGMSPADVRAMALSLQGLWTAAALQFMAPLGEDDEGFARALAEWADVARRILVAPGGQEAWDAVTSYILKVTRLSRRRLRVVVEQQIGTPAMKKFVSTWDRAVKEGEARGKVEGKAEGKAEILLRQLQKRFGRIPAATRRRVLAARPADLDRWAEAILDAESLQDVFGSS